MPRPPMTELERLEASAYTLNQLLRTEQGIENYCPSFMGQPLEMGPLQPGFGQGDWLRRSQYPGDVGFAPDISTTMPTHFAGTQHDPHSGRFTGPGQGGSGGGGGAAPTPPPPGITTAGPGGRTSAPSPELKRAKQTTLGDVAGAIGQLGNDVIDGFTGMFSSRYSPEYPEPYYDPNQPRDDRGRFGSSGGQFRGKSTAQPGENWEDRKTQAAWSGPAADPGPWTTGDADAVGAAHIEALAQRQRELTGGRGDTTGPHKDGPGPDPAVQDAQNREFSSIVAELAPRMGLNPQTIDWGSPEAGRLIRAAEREQEHRQVMANLPPDRPSRPSSGPMPDWATRSTEALMDPATWRGVTADPNRGGVEGSYKPSAADIAAGWAGAEGDLERPMPSPGGQIVDKFSRTDFDVGGLMRSLYDCGRAMGYTDHSPDNGQFVTGFGHGRQLKPADYPDSGFDNRQSSTTDDRNQSSGYPDTDRPRHQFGGSSEYNTEHDPHSGRFTGPGQGGPGGGGGGASPPPPPPGISVAGPGGRSGPSPELKRARQTTWGDVTGAIGQLGNDVIDGFTGMFSSRTGYDMSGSPYYDPNQSRDDRGRFGSGGGGGNSRASDSWNPGPFNALVDAANRERGRQDAGGAGGGSSHVLDGPHPGWGRALGAAAKVPPPDDPTPMPEPPADDRGPYNPQVEWRGLLGPPPAKKEDDDTRRKPGGEPDENDPLIPGWAYPLIGGAVAGSFPQTWQFLDQLRSIMPFARAPVYRPYSGDGSRMRWYGDRPAAIPARTFR